MQERVILEYVDRNYLVQHLTEPTWGEKILDIIFSNTKMKRNARAVNKVTTTYHYTVICDFICFDLKEEEEVEGGHFISCIKQFNHGKLDEKG